MAKLSKDVILIAVVAVLAIGGVAAIARDDLNLFGVASGFVLLGILPGALMSVCIRSVAGM